MRHIYGPGTHGQEDSEPDAYEFDDDEVWGRNAPSPLVNWVLFAFVLAIVIGGALVVWR